MIKISSTHSREPTSIIRVVSFPNDGERRARFTTMMQHHNDIDWAFHDVVPANELPVQYNDLIAFRAGGSVLSQAERSCAASHLTMMGEFLGGSADYLIAMEDDVLVDPTIRLHAHVKFMQLCGLDFYKLYARFFVPSRYLHSVGRLSFYRASWPTLGTQCYMVSRRGAQVLLDHAAANGGLKRPIDDTNDAFWSTGLPIVFPYPFPMLEIAYPSSIHGGRPLIHKRNEELSYAERRPSRLDILRKSLARRRSDLAFKNYDSRLVERIKSNREDIYAAFFS